MAKRTKADEAKARPEESKEPELTSSQKEAASKDHKDKIRTLDELRAKRAAEKRARIGSQVADIKGAEKFKREGRKRDKTAKPFYETASGFRISDVLSMSRMFNESLGLLKGKPHHLIGYTLGKMKPILKQYDADLQTHEDYEAYSKALKDIKRDALGRIARADQEELAAKFSDYLQYVKDLGEEPTDLEVRKFPNEWVDKMEGVAQLTAAINEFELWDDPDAMADRLLDGDDE